MIWKVIIDFLKSAIQPLVIYFAAKSAERSKQRRKTAEEALKNEQEIDRRQRDSDLDQRLRERFRHREPGDD